MSRQAHLQMVAALVSMLLAMCLSPVLAFHIQPMSSAPGCRLKSQPPSAWLISSWKGRFALRKFTAKVRRTGGSRMLMSGGVDPLSSLKNLEEDLEVAVAAEDYQKAAEIRDKINSFRQDTYISVLQANSEFYRAFRERSLDAMKSIWHDPGEEGNKMVVCCHPGTAPIVGRDEVVASWKAILGDGAPSLTPENVQISILGDVAWVTCEEAFGGEAGLRAPEISMLATNIFVKGEDGWKMTHHHAGPIQGRVEFLVGD